MNRMRKQFPWWQKAKQSQERREKEALTPRSNAKLKLERLRMIKDAAESKLL